MPNFLVCPFQTTSQLKMRQDKIFEFYSTSSPHLLTLILPVHPRLTGGGQVPCCCTQVHLLSIARSQWVRGCGKNHVLREFGCLLLAYCAFVTVRAIHSRGQLFSQPFSGPFPGGILFCWATFSVLCCGFLPLTSQALSILYDSYFKCGSFVTKTGSCSCKRIKCFDSFSCFFF